MYMRENYKGGTMNKIKLFVVFTNSSIEIRSSDGRINTGIPYRFDTKYGIENITHLLMVLGFDVEIRKEQQ